ncbi:unnamed protein product [Chironomus riparius]|uniref:Regulatory protein zeste n=1 Tax=Chironomus riparius TaxID=315576 RepID=A0A9N9WUM3_9DIPT|nr:unnamed protein product [Chironomus riparius]
MRMTEEKEKKAVFSSEDKDHLAETIKKITKNNKKGQISKDDWVQITKDFNSGQTGGIKTKTQLMTKFKNMKAKQKSNLSNNAREIKQTGGGSAKIVSVEDEQLFGFGDSQILGLNNPVDDDSPEIVADSAPVFIQSPTKNSKDEEEIKPLLRPGLKRKFNNESELLFLRKRNLQLQNLYLERKIQKIDETLAGTSGSINSNIRRIESDTSSSD